MIDLERTLSFLESRPRPVELAWSRLRLGRGNQKEVIQALAGYQNPDGGFGRNLEVDIAAPESQPFAVRLAMRVLIESGVSAAHPMVDALASWLDREQDDDGCWRFPEAVFAHPIAPWFAGWTFPSLNPALCLAGAAARLGIGSPTLFTRVRTLVDAKATTGEATNGQFYDVLPYAEYFPWIEHPQRDAYLDAIATGIAEREYEDAGHFFEHTGPADGVIAQRLPGELIGRQLDRLEAEQAEDGGWPSPYNDAWRPWATAGALSTLVSYGRLGGNG